MIRKIILSLLTLLLGVSLTSCSKKSSEPAVPLVFWVYDEGRVEVLTEIGKAFEAEYGVPVQVSMVDLGQIRTQFLLASGGAECADLAIIPHDNLGSLVENSAVAPVSLGSKADKFLSQSIDSFTYNGELYGVPLAVENIGFFYNADMVSKAPETLDEMVKIGTELVNSGKAEVIMGLPDATYNVWPVYTAFGGQIFGKDSNGTYDASQVAIADEGMVKGLAFMTDLVMKKLIPDAIDWDAAHVLFESGKAPFVYTGPWALNRFKTAGVNYKVAKFPGETAGKPGAPFLGVQGVIVNASSKQAKLAETFAAEFLASEENMQKIFDAEQRPSALKSIYAQLTDADSKGFMEAGKNAQPMPSIPAMGYVWDSWVAAASLAFSGEKTPMEALENAKKQVETQIEENSGN